MLYLHQSIKIYSQFTLEYRLNWHIILPRLFSQFFKYLEIEISFINISNPKHFILMGRYISFYLNRTNLIYARTFIMTTSYRIIFSSTARTHTLDGSNGHSISSQSLINNLFFSFRSCKKKFFCVQSPHSSRFPSIECGFFFRKVIFNRANKCVRERWQDSVNSL